MKLKYSSEKNIQLMVALLKEHGIKNVVASPGTTNITFIGSLMHDPFFKIYSSVDERSAAYMACGLAEETGEPVVISCTGATASRNYLPALTEAYYRKLPILAITSTREECKLGHLIDQQIDRSQQPKDTVVFSTHLQVIKDDEDWWDCTIKINKAILALTGFGGGPVHINLPTRYNSDFSVQSLPNVRKISRYFSHEVFPPINDRDVAIFIGTHKTMSNREQNAIDKFCEVYNAVVFCDSCCGYHGKYSLKPTAARKNLKMDLLIHLGEVSCVAYGCQPNEVWRVNEDGELRDTYRKLTNVFAMPEFVFFETYTRDKDKKNISKFEKFISDERNFYKGVLDVPFSNGWIASFMHDKLPKNSVVHLGIVSSFFAWNRFRLDNSIKVNCNQGGFGIDGNISSLIGASLANSDKIYYCFLGDLAFFYDLNSIGNRHIGNNVRILLVNNGRGVIFRKPANIGSIFGDETDLYMSAGNHFGNQNPYLVKQFVENLGFEYLSANSKNEFISKCPKFVDSKAHDKPMVFEVFVSTENEIKGDDIFKNTDGLKGKIRSVFGDDFYDYCRNILKTANKGLMSVDGGHN